MGIADHAIGQIEPNGGQNETYTKRKPRRFLNINLRDFS